MCPELDAVLKGLELRLKKRAWVMGVGTLTMMACRAIGLPRRDAYVRKAWSDAPAKPVVGVCPRGRAGNWHV